MGQIQKWKNKMLKLNIYILNIPYYNFKITKDCEIQIISQQIRQILKSLTIFKIVSHKLNLH